MSGHSKWANIKNKKEKTDSQRGKIFTKIGREIAIAVKAGGPDPANNSRLRDVIAKAKANNMPNDNISRSIKKAAGEGEGVNFSECTYEGYGPGGIAVIVEVVTDNTNRAAAEIRHLFDQSGGSMGQPGSVSWKFDKKGVMVVEKSSLIQEDDIMNAALEAGCDDFQTQEDVYEIYTDPADFSSVREEMEKAGYAFLSAEIQMVPKDTVDLTTDDKAELVEKFGKMLDRFDDNDDVQEVYHDALLPEEDEED